MDSRGLFSRVIRGTEPLHLNRTSTDFEVWKRDTDPPSSLPIGDGVGFEGRFEKAELHLVQEEREGFSEAHCGGWRSPLALRERS